MLFKGIRGRGSPTIIIIVILHSIGLSNFIFLEIFSVSDFLFTTD